MPGLPKNRVIWAATDIVPHNGAAQPHGLPEGLYTERMDFRAWIAGAH